MHACVLGWPLTSGWARSFGSPNLTGQYLAAGGASSWVAQNSICFSRRAFERGEGSALGKILGRSLHPGQSPICTIVFIPLSAAQRKLNADWAEAGAEAIIRRCPVCSEDSIIGHGRRHKQAHDEHHDWITIRRGLCRLCQMTITFLPVFSLPYSHYSLIARSEALRRYFVEGCSWEAAAPPVKDPHRVADSSTLRRWFQVLDSSQPPFSFLRRTVQAFDQWIQSGQIFHYSDAPLSWPTVFPLLHRFWPLRI